ncbi:MAG: IS630 family transposase [Clostridia bacterium]|nr:IS630 family transposase [Clostridia bacterium]
MATLLEIIENTEDFSLWVFDETGKRLESNNFYSWSPIGKPTMIERNGCHKGLNIIGATEVSKHFEFLYHQYTKEDGSVTAAHIANFLEQLLLHDRSLGSKVTFIQWDNATIHKGKEVKQLLKDHESDLFVLHQPPYSPELNPQEEMWHWMKNFIAKASAAKNVQELSDTIKQFKAYVAANKDKVKKRLYAGNWFK